ncbi:MAG: right-handed parallel beta-helix repeat-containing protein [Verrucomicrobiaceae bacterium]|nr:right-handed parallel beta-helix repeat-containing protein [Verrucomicrobiaceae bacterium]
MKTLFFFCLLLTLPFPASARDYHVLPQGAGMRDGTRWEHALDAATAMSLMKTGLQPGDRLRIGSGAYRGIEFGIGVTGTKAASILIEGVDTGGGLPVFSGQWDEKHPDKGSIIFTLTDSAAWVTLRGLHVRDAVVGVNAPRTKTGFARPGLRFENIDMERIRHGYYFSDCTDLTLATCTVRRYTKHGFRFEGGCVDVIVRQCVADCSEGDEAWERLTELLPFGFFANGADVPNARLRFEDCNASNHLMPLQKNKYNNGDGFVAEENNAELVFIRCRAERNQDGGFDLKPKGVRLEECVGLRNSRNFRLWSHAEMKGCFSGLASDGIWAKDGPVTATGCTFHELKNAVSVDNDARAAVRLKDCLLHRVQRPLSEDTGGTLDMDDSNRQDDQAAVKVP